MNAPRVLVKTRDLFFRARVEDLVRRGHGVPVATEPCEAAVVEVGSMTPEAVASLTAGGVRVVVFGPHVNAEQLRAFRASGVLAVPNSRLSEAVADLVSYFSTQQSNTGDL